MLMVEGAPRRSGRAPPVQMTTDVGCSRSRQALEEGAHVRVQPSIRTERLRAEIDEVFPTSGDLATAVEQVARLGAQLLLQAALEADPARRSVSGTVSRAPPPCRP